MFHSFLSGLGGVAFACLLFLLDFVLLGSFKLVHSDASDSIEFDGLFEKFYVAFRLRGLQAFTGWPDYGACLGYTLGASHDR